MSRDEKRMSFTEHLGELRTRLIRSCVALLAAVIICYALSNQIFSLLSWPLRPLNESGIIVTDADPEAITEGADAEAAAAELPQKAIDKVQWTVLNPLEFIVVKFKIAGYGGLLLALPFILWQLCAFIFPGLFDNERRVIQILIFGCSLLALAGVSVAYFGVFPVVLPYLLEWIPEGVLVQLRLNETLNIIVILLFGFAAAFQFPMVVLILVYMGLLTPQGLKQYRKIAIVAMAILSAILTPPDPVSMIVMVTPLVILYELSILGSYLVVRRKQAKVTE
ncbi:MAG: twin-arginine translocase subunit TatC [Candidatus Hydrogenedentes bacterium]|nr:twin-arginine translocase subunit TatC [Candidatus Hydrogenedentota bacterium]